MNDAQKRWAEWSAALVAAQSECRNVSYDKQNPHFRSKYASLEAVRDEVAPKFHKHGLAIVQGLQTEVVGDHVLTFVVTKVIHKNGYGEIVSRVAFTPTKNDPQGQASASSYARRYSLQMVGCIAGTEEDDDGNEASVQPAVKVYPAKKGA